jgi:type II secretory pathway pseudopilin PulG
MSANNTNYKFKSKSGYSIVETIILISVFTVVLIVLMSSILFFYKANNFNVEQAFAVSTARKGVEIMVSNIREATYADDGAYPIFNISSTTMTFFSDIDNDDSVERIRFFLDSDSIFKKAVLESSGDPPVYVGTESISFISSDVRNIEENTNIFNYYDDTGTEITDYDNVSDVAFIGVNLIVNINPARLPNEFTLKSSATLRNLKVNL